MTERALRPDRDFSPDVLDDLYSYPRKSPAVAWLLWVFLGWAGGHRFYLGREFTGVLMLLTGGGSLIWWGIDGFLLRGMIRGYNEDQALREREGLPPRALDAMPALHDQVLTSTPGWVERWRSRGPVRRGLGTAGDILVLLLASQVLGALVASGSPGGIESALAVLLLAGFTALGSGPDWLDDVPGAAAIHRWSHQLRLYYRHNPPGSPLALLLRPLVGAVIAPFSRKARAEVRLYVELGAGFTAFFLLLDVVPGLVWPALAPGLEVDLEGFVGEWIGEVFGTFFLVYAFSTAVGAVLVRHLLLRDSHRVPRILAALTMTSILLRAIGGS
ncbi:MAG TPA: TM2 domain-containing protein [Longimicrobiales bacterium]|nr:TM2 domain-containing protein [Longimicrobiales bacterium]